MTNAMVIGGGVAGVYAALDISAQGFEVMLVESDPSIGGIMAALDKTFPTMDCSI
jgi:heterodisulfide reductase subunit A